MLFKRVFFIIFRYIAILVVNCVDILFIIHYFAIFLYLPLFHFCSALSFSAADNSRVSAVLVTVATAGARWRREAAERLRRRRTGDQGPVLTVTSPGEDRESTGQASDWASEDQ